MAARVVPSLLEQAVKRLKGKEPGWERAVAPPAQGAKPPQRAQGLPASAQQATGAASAFAEADYAEREYWPAVTITSSDGLFVLSYDPIKSILLEDGSRATFKQPT